MLLSSGSPGTICERKTVRSKKYSSAQDRVHQSNLAASKSRVVRLGLMINLPNEQLADTKEFEVAKSRKMMGFSHDLCLPQKS